MNLKHEGYHNVKCISKSSGIEITETRGDEDLFPSSSLLGEYVSLEGWFKNAESRLNHHLSGLFGVSSLAWTGHLAGT